MVMGFQGYSRQQVMGPGGIGDQYHQQNQDFRRTLAQAGQSGGLQNWFAAQDPRIQMAIASGNVGNGISTPYGNIANGNMANRLMGDVRMYGGNDWNNAGAQLQNYASYQNAGTNPYADNKGIMNFTPGGGSWGASMWDTFNGGKGIQNGGKYSDQNTPVWGAAKSGPAGSFLAAPGLKFGTTIGPGGAANPPATNTGAGAPPPGSNTGAGTNPYSNLGVGGAGWQGQYPNGGSFNPYEPVASGGQTAGVPGQPTGNATQSAQAPVNLGAPLPNNPYNQTPATVAQPFTRQQRYAAR